MIVRKIENRVHEALDRWGEWLRAGAGETLGFPHETIIGRCMREGAGASQGGKRPAGYSDAAAEQLDQLICRMPRRLRRAVVLYWGYGLPEVAAASLYPTSRYYIKQHLERAEQWLRNELDEA